MAEEKKYSKLEEAALEIKSLRRIISAYLNYPDAAEEDIRRYERSYKKLSPEHKALLSHLPTKYEKLRRCISMNTFFIMNMLQAFQPPLDMSQDIDIDETENLENAHSVHRPIKSAENFQENSICLQQSALLNRSCSNCEPPKQTTKNKVTSQPLDWLDPSLQLNVPLVDVDKVRRIIRNIVRDWALEGQKERDQCYKPILEELNRLFPDRCEERPPCCLVPGAGLGRLALEISCLGFISQGIELSYYMMICSSFILNHTQVAGEWTVCPWIHSNCNSLSDHDQLRPVSFPDIHPASAGITEGFSMCGGDFVEVYSDESQAASWDVVVTCFFLDTAKNIVEYIEIISKILKDGGVWINLDPLLYHFADTNGPNDEMSIELSLEDVKMIAFQYGFELEMETMIETTYSVNPRAMMQNHYIAAFWAMRKKQREPSGQ